MVGPWQITISRKNQHFTLFWDLGEVQWSRLRPLLGKKLKLILSQLIPLTELRKGLRRKREFLRYSKGLLFKLTWCHTLYSVPFCAALVPSLIQFLILEWQVYAEYFYGLWLFVLHEHPCPINLPLFDWPAMCFCSQEWYTSLYNLVLICFSSFLFIVITK